MARITAEDCREVVNNCFELVLLASYRAKELSKGAKPAVDKENDKNAVIALREIADKAINSDNLRNVYIKSLGRNANPDVCEDSADTVTTEESELFEQSTSFIADNEAVNIDNFVSFEEDEIEAED